jgi:glycosyltransferase involved in cell wall biosynthesis
MRERFGLERPYVLAVGSLEPRKGLDVLLDVAEGIEGTDVVLAGSPSFRSAALLERAAALPACRLLGPVDDAHLPDLYRAADALLAPSLYEGFGLTPLEALAAGVPIVVLDTPVAREIYGDAAQYVSRGDIDGTAVALRRCLTSPECGTARLARAPAILARYSWDTAADRTLAHLERVAAR